MKKIIFSLLISISSLLLMTLLCSILVSFLQYNKGIKINSYVIQIVSILFFLLSGMIFGFINKKQGLIGAILFILVYLITLIIFNLIDNTSKFKLYYFFIFTKCFAYTLGCIISVNLRKN